MLSNFNTYLEYTKYNKININFCFALKTCEQNMVRMTFMIYVLGRTKKFGCNERPFLETEGSFPIILTQFLNIFKKH